MEERVEFRNRHVNGGRGLLGKSVQYQTSRKYSTDWRRWTAFLEKFLDQVEESDKFMEGLSLKGQLETILAYMHYCAMDCSLQASTITQSLSGVAHHFKINLLPKVAFGHASVKAAKTALMLEDRKREESSVRHRKLPFTMNMLKDAVAHLRFRGNIHKEMIATALILAFFCLFRSSEYVPNHKGSLENRCHAILAGDVEFEVEIDGVKAMLDASQVRSWMWPFVSLVRFTLRSAKNDTLRMGSVFWFRNLDPEGKNPGFNVVKEAFDWAVLSRPEYHSFFLSYRRGDSRVWTLLKYNEVSQAIKDCAERFGFSADEFGTHSPRVGGACTLRAGGASDSMQQLLGRWKSFNSMLVYNASGRKEFDIMQCILRSGADFSDYDVRLLNDAVKEKARTHPQLIPFYSGRSVRFAA